MMKFTLSMATEKEARIARDKYFDFLSERGAHTLAVDYLKNEKRNGFAIIAFTEGDTRNIPDTLEIENNGKTTSVPVVAQKAEKFKPQ